MLADRRHSAALPSYLSIISTIWTQNPKPLHSCSHHRLLFQQVLHLPLPFLFLLSCSTNPACLCFEFTFHVVVATGEPCTCSILWNPLSLLEASCNTISLLNLAVILRDDCNRNPIEIRSLSGDSRLRRIRVSGEQDVGSAGRESSGQLHRHDVLQRAGRGHTSHEEQGRLHHGPEGPAGAARGRHCAQPQRVCGAGRACLRRQRRPRQGRRGQLLHCVNSRC